MDVKGPMIDWRKVMATLNFVRSDIREGTLTREQSRAVKLKIAVHQVHVHKNANAAVKFLANDVHNSLVNIEKVVAVRQPDLDSRVERPCRCGKVVAACGACGQGYAQV